MVPKPIHIYHITDIANLDSIINNGGIFSHNLMGQNSTSYTNIAYGHIQDRRASTEVPLPPFGNLHDYVPFYFAPRSPMLYAINKGIVPGYSHGQDKIVHLVTSVEMIKQINGRCVFTDGHAVISFSEFYDDIVDLDHIDWDVMKSRYWDDDHNDPDRCRRRQAEFLVHKSVPWSAIIGIGVKDERIESQVMAILTKHGVQTKVAIKRDWYY